MISLKPRIHMLLLVTMIALAVALALAVSSFMRIMHQETDVKVDHFRIKVADLWIVGFTLKSPISGFYRYSMIHNSSIGVVSYSDTGYIEPPNSFTYALNIKPEKNETIIVNIKIWWGEQLIDEVKHYIRADEG
ncbi:hypothetical protein KEJ29_06360 [Candidatus Bathyarchaeota archaeon]|nr:hypothetical protein [Candidatus Bathyarchaeota archaeon]